MEKFDRRLARDTAETLRVKRRELSTLAIPAGRGWQPLREPMAELLGRPVGDIGAVIGRLRALQILVEDLPPGAAANRLAAFNSLYLTITRRVDGALTDGVADPEFLELLDVHFARRYLAALDLWNNDDEDTPDVWEVLFKRAGDTRMTRLVAAMLGVNAHINHDLSLALLDTWAQTGAPEPDDVTIHPDYLLVNRIFHEEIPPLRRGFSDDWQMELDRLVGPLDDWSERMLVRVTRARAWEQGRRLWLLRADPADMEQARRAMDRAASLVAEWALCADRLVTDVGDGWSGLHWLWR